LILFPDPERESKRKTLHHCYQKLCILIFEKLCIVIYHLDLSGVSLNCKFSNVQSGIANAAYRPLFLFLYIPLVWGIRAEKPLQLLHADLTIFRPIDNTKVYIYFLADNFSRKILAWKASLQYSAKLTFENLKEVYERYKLENMNPEVDFMTDGGIENKAEVDTFIETHRINKIIAQKDVMFSNSMIEAVNKRIKYDFLFPQVIQNYEQTVKHLESAVEIYNNKPYHPLQGLTPNEAFAGKLPETAKFKEQIAEASRLRIIENRKTKCINHK
jgi:putative transposase